MTVTLAYFSSNLSHRHTYKLSKIKHQLTCTFVKAKTLKRLWARFLWHFKYDKIPESIELLLPSIRTRDDRLTWNWSYKEKNAHKTTIRWFWALWLVQSFWAANESAQNYRGINWRRKLSLYDPALNKNYKSYFVNYAVAILWDLFNY